MQMSQDFDKLFTMSLNQTGVDGAGAETTTSSSSSSASSSSSSGSSTSSSGGTGVSSVTRAVSALTPRAAGQSENVTVLLDRRELGHNVTLFLSLRALDRAGNAGELSNIVTLSRAWQPSVPMEALPSEHGLEFYLKLVVPPVATLLLFLALVAVVVLSRRRRRRSGRRRGAGNKGAEDSLDMDEDSGGGGSMCAGGLSAASTYSLDLSHMNYRHEGQYRPRCQEDPETWSELSKSREHLGGL